MAHKNYMVLFIVVICFLSNVSFANDVGTQEKERSARFNKKWSPNKTLTINRYAEVILSDISGSFYQIWKAGRARAGIGSYNYTLENLETGEKTIFMGGVYDAEQGGCGRPELGIERAVDDVDLQIKKVNSDPWLDISVTYTEKDCSTGKMNQISNVFLATKNGFVAQTEN